MHPFGTLIFADPLSPPASLRHQTLKMMLTSVDLTDQLTLQNLFKNLKYQQHAIVKIQFCGHLRLIYPFF